MSDISKLWIKDIQAGKDINSNLPKYAQELSANYRNSAMLDIVMEYTMLYETWVEGQNSELEATQSECEVIHRAISNISKGQSVSDMLTDFENVRKQITEKMQVVTAYVDRFLIYEYVLNRIEYRFAMNEDERKEELSTFNIDEYVRDLVQYIFETNDNVVVNDRVREIVEQLPVRMARSKYLDIIKKSLSLYKDADKYSLDGYVYMLRTSAMIYEPEGMDRHFTWFGTLLDELSEVDFAAIDSAHFMILQEKIYNASGRLQDISDIYMILQKLANMLYTVAINDGVDDSQCIAILGKLSEAFGEDFEEELDVTELLYPLEGSMEQFYEDRILLESILEEVMLGFAVDIYSMGIKDIYDNLEKSKVLFSTSLFAEFDEQEEEPVTEEYLSEVTDALLGDLLEVIKCNKRPVIRAVMASTLGKVPVFFGNSEEVLDYIKNAFEQCSDEAELIASIKLLDDLMEM